MEANDPLYVLNDWEKQIQKNVSAVCKPLSSLVLVSTVYFMLTYCDRKPFRTSGEWKDTGWNSAQSSDIRGHSSSHSEFPDGCYRPRPLEESDMLLLRWSDRGCDTTGDLYELE